ncbi:MAG: TatD family hydrolase [Candidatus Heimdallarchaeota archaeon]|nr:TatD family hydrolase [Candidatus Heimdallarchaeota archaeon]
MRFHDAHCHIASKSFQKDFELESSMRKWIDMGLDYVIGVSTKYSESKKILDLSKEYEKIIPGIGVHPWSAKKPITDEIKESFFHLFSESKQVVVGEIGLDYHFIKNEERYPYQEQYFRFFLQIAEKNNLPVNIHLKGAEEDVASILSTYRIKSSNVLIHWYSGPTQTLKKFIERDYFFTINPSILTGSPHIEVLKEVSINRILTESDGNVKYTINNERVIGSPGIIPKVMNKIIEITPYDLDEISKILYDNLRNYTNIG